MRALRLLSFFLLTATAGFGSAPDRIDGMIYYQVTRTLANSGNDFANVLSADGTYSQLYRLSTGAGAVSSGPYVLSDPETGTFIYKKLDDVTAELTFTTSAGAQKRTLTFTSDSEGGGMDVGPTGNLPYPFRLVPVASGSSLLVNCSNRSFLNPGKAAFTGFVVTGGSANTERIVIVRAVGPGLGIFGITDFLRNPQVSVVRASDNHTVGSNDDWSSESATAISRTSSAVGAFPLSAGSKDAVVILSLKAGAYVAQVTSPDATDTGQTLIEVYILP